MTTLIELVPDNLPPLDLWLMILAGLPVWRGLLIVVGGSAAMALLGSLLIGLMQGIADPADNILIGAKFDFLGEAFAALLAFVLVDGGIRYAVARQQVQVEVNALRMFDAVTANFSASRAQQLRHGVRSYAASVVEQEFLTMQWGQESPVTRRCFEQLLTDYLRLDTRSERDSLIRLQADQFFTKLLESRQKRLQASRPGLRTLIWMVFLVNMLIAIIFNWFFRARSLGAHIALAVVTTIAIVIVAYLALLLYHPFTGDLAISAAPYQTLPAL